MDNAWPIQTSTGIERTTRKNTVDTLRVRTCRHEIAAATIGVRYITGRRVAQSNSCRVKDATVDGDIKVPACKVGIRDVLDSNVVLDGGTVCSSGLTLRLNCQAPGCINLRNDRSKQSDREADGYYQQWQEQLTDRETPR